MNWTDTNARAHPRRGPTVGVLAPRERPDWMEQAACKNKTDLFFPGEHGGAEIAAARRICAACPVRDACLTYALDYGEKDGIWGGTSGEQRNALNRARRAS
jgi:WhiB family redox-sensing transcriptional regulator